MNIGFYLTEGGGINGYIMADMLLRSIRAKMPDSEIVQFTDKNSSGLYGTNFVKRDKSTNRLEHYASVIGEWMFIDSDSMVNDSVEEVFEQEFDIAICDRIGVMLQAEVGSPFMEKMPYNLGVVFSRSREFWNDAIREWELLDESDRGLLIADQLSVCNLIRKGKYDVKILPGRIYNNSPNYEGDTCDNAKVIHYKGQRKYWMIKEFYHECGMAA